MGRFPDRPDRKIYGFYRNHLYARLYGNSCRALGGLGTTSSRGSQDLIAREAIDTTHLCIAPSRAAS